MELAVAGIVVFLVVLFILITLVRTIVIVRQADTAIVERLGRYSRTLSPGLSILVPVVDRIRQRVDMREQVASFPPQPVITEDNLVVSIDTVIYFQVTDPKAATYEISSYLLGIEQLTVTTLRNVIGSMDLEQALTSRDQINGQLRGVLDEATGKWGIRVNRVELKAIDPPHSVQEAMEKQLKAERERRAAILTAEGQKQASILTAEGAKQSAVLSAEGEAQAAVLRAEGEAKARVIAADAEAQAVQTIYAGLRSADPQPNELAHRYLTAIPEIAKGDANKVWVLPTELTSALSTIRAGLSGTGGTPPES
jgi:regulator of protease activity HflC (stomatin/prohibitin superfamily)